jgi:hypothetical protein
LVQDRELVLAAGLDRDLGKDQALEKVLGQGLGLDQELVLVPEWDLGLVLDLEKVRDLGLVLEVGKVLDLGVDPVQEKDRVLGLDLDLELDLEVD